MSGVWTAARIRQELDRLATERGRLTAALTLGANQLAATGMVPDASLLADLADYRQQLRSLISHLPGDAPLESSRLSLELLEEHFQQSQQRDELVRQLEQIAGLVHVDDPNYAPLARCREDALRCQHRLTSVLNPDDTEQTRLLAGQHVLQAVLTLSDQAVELTDEDWNRLQDVVALVYGRNLTTALVRGRIRRSVITAPSAPTVVENELPSIHALAGSHIRQTVALTAPVTEESVHTDPNAPMATDPNGSTRWFSAGSSVLPGVAMAELQREEGESPAAEAGLSTTKLDAVVQNIDLSLSKPVWHVDAAAHLAREMGAETPRTVLRTNALVRQLVRDDRVAVAAQVARCGERLASGRGIVPSAGLLRALVLGRSVSYARGELAREVDHDLKPFVNSTPFVTYGDDELLGLSLMQRAAALLPALLGASTAAPAVLRSFAIEPGLSHLYNYCSRVAAFGERLQSQVVELFQAPAEHTQWQAERKQLQTDVREWLAHSLKRGVSYQRSSPLFLHAHWTVLASPTQRHPHAVMEWARWQEVLLLAHRMLRPLCDRQVERNTVRVELARAAALVQMESPDTPHGKPGSGRGLTPLTEPMRNLLLEAIDLANRWLRIESSTPSRGLPLAPQQADELRAELLERTHGVVAELDVLARTRTADIVQTGVCACRRTIEHIRQLCAGEVPLALHEPDSRHLLYGEFLKMPHVELQDNWQPAGELAEQEQAILEHLSSGWSDWRSAFLLQCQQEDHLASARVLELPVWTDAETLAALHQHRGQELLRARQSVLRELDEMASQMALDAQDRPELDAVRTELNLRLERLRAAVPQIQAFATARTRLDRYREQWRRLVSGESLRTDPSGPAVKDDSGILPSLSAAVNAAAQTTAVASESVEHWVFLEE